MIAEAVSNRVKKQTKDKIKKGVVMKKVLLATLGAMFLAAQAVPVNAAQVAFTVSATIPANSSVSIAATSVLSADATKRSAVINNQLTMDPMVFNSALGIFLPDHYFVLDMGATGGGLDVVMTYAEGANPNGTGHGLGWKSAATFQKVVGTVETNITGHGDANGKKLLKDVTSEHFLPADTTGGFLRAYVGVNTGDAKTPALGEVFTTLDKTGAYAGTLTVTATAV